MNEVKKIPKKREKKNLKLTIPVDFSVTNVADIENRAESSWNTSRAAEAQRKKQQKTKRKA